MPPFSFPFPCMSCTSCMPTYMLHFACRTLPVLARLSFIPSVLPLAARLPHFQQADPSGAVYMIHCSHVKVQPLSPSRVDSEAREAYTARCGARRVGAPQHITVGVQRSCGGDSSQEEGRSRSKRQHKGIARVQQGGQRLQRRHRRRALRPSTRCFLFWRSANVQNVVAPAGQG